MKVSQLKKNLELYKDDDLLAVFYYDKDDAKRVMEANESGGELTAEEWAKVVGEFASNETFGEIIDETFCNLVAELR